MNFTWLKVINRFGHANMIVCTCPFDRHDVCFFLHTSFNKKQIIFIGNQGSPMTPPPLLYDPSSSTL